MAGPKRVELKEQDDEAKQRLKVAAFLERQVDNNLVSASMSLLHAADALKVVSMEPLSFEQYRNRIIAGLEGLRNDVIALRLPIKGLVVQLRQETMQDAMDEFLADVGDATGSAVDQGGEQVPTGEAGERPAVQPDSLPDSPPQAVGEAS